MIEIKIPEEIGDLTKDLEAVDQIINRLVKRKEELCIHNLNKKLYPFKIGDCVYANVSNGHYTKRRKCILECDDRGILLLRPYTDDGKLYKRIFYCEKLEGNYSDYFEKVE